MARRATDKYICKLGVGFAMNVFCLLDLQEKAAHRKKFGFGFSPLALEEPKPRKTKKGVLW